jgi:hypothetical protein
MMKRNKAVIDPEMAEFEAALLRGIDEGLRGEGRKTTSRQCEGCAQSADNDPVRPRRA